RLRHVGGRRSRKRLGRIAMRIEERNYVGAVLRIAEACEGHLGTGRERLRAVQPLSEIVPTPVAALLRQSVGESAAPPPSDRFAQHGPKVGSELVGAALVGVVTSRALVEDLLALRGIGLGQIDLDRLLGFGRSPAFLLHAGDRKAHFLWPLGMKYLTGNNR